ncbi:hypothetical protein BH24ACT10_BH24ACT10_18980 [soil metagenome]
MERALSDADQVTSGLVLALFQRREYFDLEAPAYAALAATGNTVGGRDAVLRRYA